MEDSSEDDDLSEFVHAGPACTKCGRTGHKPRYCRGRVLIEKCGKRCGHCADMSHRREEPVCLGCKKPYEPEVLVHEIPGPGSGADFTGC